MKKKIKNLFWVCSRARMAMLFAVSMVAVSACALPPKQLDNNDELQERVALWWQARLKRDHAQMYELYDPDYRERVNFSAFLQESALRSRFEIVSFSISGIAREAGDRAKAEIELTFLFSRNAATLHSRLEEHWLRKEGKWYKEYEPPRPPIPQPGEVKH